MLTPKKMIQRIFCDHKGTLLTLTKFKDLWNMELIKEETKCLRCGTVVTRDPSVIKRRKEILKTIRNILFIVSVILLMIGSFFLGIYITAIQCVLGNSTLFL